MTRGRTNLSMPMIMGIIAAFVVVLGLATPVTSQAADVLQEQRTLFMTERFQPLKIRGPLGRQDVLPEQLVVLRGEREGFQLAVRNTSGEALNLQGRIVPDPALAAALQNGTISYELLRVAFTRLPKPSSRVEKATKAPDSYRAGIYADALPPLRNNSANGRLSIANGQWGGLTMLAMVRVDAAAAVYGGTLELYVPGAQEDAVYARQPFSLDVRNKVLKQGGEKDSFKTVMRVEAEAYWLQDKAMRNGPSAGFPTQPDRMLQAQGLVSFLDSRGVTLTEQPFGAPNAKGKYECASYRSHHSLRATPFLDQLRNRYFGIAREIDPSATQFPARMFPSETNGCDPDSSKDAYNGKVDKYRTPSIKQDDVLHGGAKSFYRNLGNEWKSHRLFGKQTYVKNPFDEPSDRTDRMRAQYTREVPKATRFLRQALGKRAMIVLADWPRDNRSERVCRKSGGKIASCATISGDGFSNRSMWDGRGSDDIDVWLAPFSRLYGRTVPAKIKRSYKINRDTEYATRLAKIKKLKGGREVWAYNFFTANAMQPQLTIDAPATDARMNYWLLAREGHTGLYVSNTILGWGQEKQYNSRTRTLRKGNPWDGATYFEHQSYGAA
ncbi:MAG: hypothetical protein ABI200_02870, partial [Gaiellales bacterium]